MPGFTQPVHGLKLHLTFSFVSSHPLAIELIASGKIDVKPLITHRFPLEESLKAFEVARTGADGAIKVMINCWKD